MAERWSPLQERQHSICKELTVKNQYALSGNQQTMQQQDRLIDVNCTISATAGKCHLVPQKTIETPM